MTFNQGIRQRSVVLFLNVLISYLVFLQFSDYWVPSPGLELVWLISAISIWFLSLLTAPWFLPPKDAVIGGVGALSILLTMSIPSTHEFSVQLELMRKVSSVYLAAVIVVAVLALFLSDRDKRSPFSKLAFKLTGIFGQGEIMFSAPAIIGIVGYYYNSPVSMAWILVFWIVLVVAKPIELAFVAWNKFQEELSSKNTMPTVGEIDRIDYPNIIRVKLNSEASWQPNRLFRASVPDGSQIFVVSLFAQIQGSEVIGTGLSVATAQEKIVLPMGMVCDNYDEEGTKNFLEKLSGAKDAALVGFVVENSTINIVSFEVSTRTELNEGDVVFVSITGRDVFYQIVGAETFEENFDQNPRGSHVVKAAQLGIYSPSDGFTKYPWLPAMNTPLFSAGSRQFEAAGVSSREFEIGSVPSTNVKAVANIDDLVEYHTAILGITGTGKTEVALDIIKKSVENGIKVFCVDFTGDYRHRLADQRPNYPSPSRAEGKELEDNLFAVETGTYGAPAEKKVLKAGIEKLRVSTETQIDDFLSNSENHLAIFELAEISNTKASLRITELYLSSIMDWARNHRGQKKVLIVLEEAHTIVPEAHGSGFDFDTQFVVSRIGQIALQGRKYGVGLLVISQRTALVSKTILSQCNTFLTHSLIDQTSLNFLQSVYSSQHTKLIPNLGRFEFLAFGKAIKAERPIILKREFDQKLWDASKAVGNPVAEDGEAAGEDVGKAAPIEDRKGPAIS